MEIEHQRRLIRAVARGERQAFEELYEGSGSRLYGVAMQLMRTPERAEEALQEAYVKIWHNAGEYHEGRASVMTWMSSIVRYRCIDMLRAISRKEGRQDSIDQDDTLELVAPELVSPLNPEAPDTAALTHCMGTLNQNDLQFIHLAYYQGLTHAEIQEHNDTPLGTVKSWIRRGLQRLKGCLNNELS